MAMDCICEVCGEHFISEGPDEAAEKEYEILHGGAYDPDAVAIVCDSCYEIILESNEELKHMGTP